MNLKPEHIERSDSLRLIQPERQLQAQDAIEFFRLNEPAVEQWPELPRHINSRPKDPPVENANCSRCGAAFVRPTYQTRWTLCDPCAHPTRKPQ